MYDVSALLLVFGGSFWFQGTLNRFRLGPDWRDRYPGYARWEAPMAKIGRWLFLAGIVALVIAVVMQELSYP